MQNLQVKVHRNKILCFTSSWLRLHVFDVKISNRFSGGQMTWWLKELYDIPETYWWW